MKFESEVLYSNVGISFWGGVCPITGTIIDHTHSLYGECIADKILCIPSGRGSCTGSQVMLELLLNGKGPRAIILRDADSILCTGAIVAEEFFKDECPSIPIICAVKDQFSKLQEYSSLQVFIQKENVNGQEKSQVIISSSDNGYTHSTQNLMELSDTLEIDPAYDLENQSEATRMAFQTVKRVAAISNATKLLPIACAHIDAVTFIGQGGLRFAQKLAELGGKVSVPTTLNSQSVDRRRWAELGVDASLAKNANAVGDAYLKLGAEMSFTCAPYLLPTKPSFQDNIMWGESNAVVYANSVLGARTEKYADYFDICAAIIGKVPNIGVHIESNRQPKIVIDATSFIQQHILPYAGNAVDSSIDAFFPLMGWLCGNLSDGHVPLILGFDKIDVTEDNLKAFCAAYGTTGTAPLFHMAYVTPEAKADTTVVQMRDNCRKGFVEVKMVDVRDAYISLDSGNIDNDCGEIDLVALGNPHLSITELKLLSERISADGRPKKSSVEVVATLSREVLEKGKEFGYTHELEKFGVKFINDTCWCMLLSPPIIPEDLNARILTNSGKYAHYGPALTNRSVRFGSFNDCIEGAKTGKIKAGHTALPVWIRSFATRAFTLVAK